MQKTIAFIRSQLQDLYPDSEIKSFGYLILESVCRTDRQSLWRDKDKQLSPDEQLQIREIVAGLKKYRPIQYILGETEFYGLKFKVNEDVLIPRPETEELVDWIRKDLSPDPSPQEKGEADISSFVQAWKSETAQSPLSCGEGQGERSILDIGAGSGCIAVSLAKHLPFASVYALDISEKALEIARQNAEINGVKVHFFQHDILTPLSILHSQFSIIVSNPPYVTPEEKKGMSKNVLDYEPHQALFIPQDKPLLFYERIADIARERLEKGGALYFETSSLYGKATRDMLKSKGYRFVELKQDISGKDRMIKAYL